QEQLHPPVGQLRPGPGQVRDLAAPGQGAPVPEPELEADPDRDHEPAAAAVPPARTSATAVTISPNECAPGSGLPRLFSAGGRARPSRGSSSAVAAAADTAASAARCQAAGRSAPSPTATANVS